MEPMWYEDTPDASGLGRLQTLPIESDRWDAALDGVDVVSYSILFSPICVNSFRFVPGPMGRQGIPLDATCHVACYGMLSYCIVYNVPWYSMLCRKHVPTCELRGSGCGGKTTSDSTRWLQRTLAFTIPGRLRQTISYTVTYCHALIDFWGFL